MRDDRVFCSICGCVLNDPQDPSSLDCGGDCRLCMAEAGDPDCAAAVRQEGGAGATYRALRIAKVASRHPADFYGD